MAAVDYITSAELKAYMGVDSSDTSYATDAATMITAASRALNDYLQREITPSDAGPTLRRVDFRPGEYVVDLAPWDLRSCTLVQLHPEASSPQTLSADTDYVLEPIEADDGVYQQIHLSGYLLPVSDRLFRFGRMQLGITGAWGMSAVPDLLKRACAVAAQAWLQPIYAAAYTPDDPREVRPGGAATFELPLAALRLANGYRRSPGVV